MGQEITDLLERQDVAALQARLKDMTTVAVADEMSRRDTEEQAFIFRLLDKDRAIQVFEYLDVVHQADLLSGLREARFADLLLSLPDDDRAQLFGEMPAAVAARMMADLPADRRKVTAQLLGYPDESAGRVMTPVPTVISVDNTREQALKKLRGRQLRNRDIAVLAVTDATRHLVGVVNLAALVSAADGTPVSELMNVETHAVNATEDQEVAARLVQEADLLALPVVDGEGRFLGVITVDDAMEILEQEVTEDVYRAGGSEPLKQPYLSATVFDLARKRGVWLLVLILTAVLTVNVMSHFEDTLAKVVVLATFVPMVTGTGGNAGSQAASSVVRALAVDEVRPRDIWKVIWRETRVGFMLGVFLGALIFPFITLFYDWRIGAVMGLTIVAICTWACIVGGILPLIARKIGVDPAVFSTPVVSTLVDATGLVIYFSIAQVILSSML
ncbi:magnesium transporter [Corynebacterium sp. AOP40-9SA-29]|uniref:magnesium transporter n=1 Tax=Corynebacterium sp. AOP40-9SA-29 TaxID=3457677 RepID=UPI0040339CC5